MTYTRWWHSLLISFSVCTWGLAQPLYSFVVENYRLEGAAGPAFVLFMLIYQSLPVVVLFLVDRVLPLQWGLGIGQRPYRVALFVGTAFVFLRALQLGENLPLAGPVESLPLVLKLMLLLALLTVVAAFIAYFSRTITLLFIYLSVPSAILTGLFVIQVGLLGEVWRDNSPEPRVAQRVTNAGQIPVFILVFDGLGNDVLFKDGTIDAIRFPNFAALSQDSAVFTNATSNYLTSWRSTTSIMTGASPPDDATFQRDPSWSASVGILATLVAAGYLVDFRSEIFRCQRENSSICGRYPSAANTNIHLAVRDFFVWFLPRPVARAGRDLVLMAFPKDVTIRIPFDTTHQNSRAFWDGFVASVSTLQSPGTVYFVHPLLPHQPYEFDFEGNIVRSLSDAQQFDDFPRMAEAYKEQVMFVDTLLGEFTARLEAEGLYDDSLVIVTGDHGPRSLGLGHKFSGFDRSADFPDEITDMIPRVPLLIHGPGIVPSVLAVDYQHIDLMPTVLDILKLPVRADLAGVSVFASKRPDRNKVFYTIPNEGEPGEKVSYTYDAESGRWRKAVSRD